MIEPLEPQSRRPDDWPGQRLLVFEVPGIPHSPNMTRRQHFHQNAAEANVWKDATFIALHEGHPHRPGKLASVRLVLTAMTKTRGRRDPDNFAAACKPIIDALVTGGLLVDDSFSVIRELVVRREVAGRDAVRIEVWS